MMRLVTVLALAGSLVAGAAMADEVNSKTLGPKQCKIIRDDMKGVEAEFAGGVSSSVKRDDVIKIKYDLLGGAYERAEAMFKNGKYDEALDELKDMLTNFSSATNAQWAKQYVYFLAAQCADKADKAADAIEYYKKLAAEVPETRFKREMAEGMFGGFVKLGKWDDAAKSLAALEALGEDGKFLASVYRAELLERKAENKEGEFSKAAEAYKTVLKGSPAPEVQAKALVGAARCMLLDGQTTDAVDYAKKALAVKGCPNNVSADAHQVIGEGFLAGVPEKGKELASEQNTGKVLDAVEEMMRPILQYKGSPWAEQRAYYFVGLWTGRLAASGVIGEWKARSVWAFRELAAKYPKSPMLAKPQM